MVSVLKNALLLPSEFGVQPRGHSVVLQWSTAWSFSPFLFEDTPGHGSGWAETPRTDRGGDSIGETPTPGASKRKSH